jgi:hypothetical protein
VAYLLLAALEVIIINPPRFYPPKNISTLAPFLTNVGMRYKRQIIIIAIGVFSMVLHLLPGIHFEYHRDELLYFSLVNHLDFGYSTTPPFTGLIAFIAKSIFGYSVFSTRFFPSIVSGLLVYLTAMIAGELNGGFRSQVLSAVGVAGTMFLVTIYGVFTPFFFDIFFWTLAIYFFIRFVKTSSNTCLIALGVAIGFSLLNKYSIAFLVVAALMVLPFTRHRAIFSNRFFYYALLISLLISLPNIIWQMYHHFPVINHMKELNQSQLVNVNRIEFLTGQLILLLPFTFIVVPGIIFFLVNRELRDFRFLVYVSLVVLLLLLVLRGKSIYASGLYPFLIITGALFIEKVVVRKYMFSLVVILLIVMSALLMPLNLPVLNPRQMMAYYDGFAKITGNDLLRKDEDGHHRQLPQIHSDMLGWNEITEITDRAWDMVENKNRSIIFCANYGQAGAISIIGKKYGLPEPVSFSDAFRYWMPAEFETSIDEVVYVIGTDAIDSGNFMDTKEFFSEMIVVGQVNNPLAIEHGTTIFLFKNPKHNFNDFWKVQTRGIATR